MQHNRPKTIPRCSSQYQHLIQRLLVTYKLDLISSYLIIITFQVTFLFSFESRSTPREKNWASPCKSVCNFSVQYMFRQCFYQQRIIMFCIILFRLIMNIETIKVGIMEIANKARGHIESQYKSVSSSNSNSSFILFSW